MLRQSKTIPGSSSENFAHEVTTVEWCFLFRIFLYSDRERTWCNCAEKIYSPVCGEYIKKLIYCVPLHVKFVHHELECCWSLCNYFSCLLWRSLSLLFSICSAYTGLSLRAAPVTPVNAELTGCYGCCNSPLYIVLSAYSQIVTGVHTQITAD